MVAAINALSNESGTFRRAAVVIARWFPQMRKPTQKRS